MDASIDTDGLCKLTATEMASLVRDGAISASSLVDSVLSRIARLEPSLNAFALVDAAGAREAAAAADAARQKGEPLGPLHGVPFSVKDLILTKGVETAFGSHLLAGNIPKRDAAAVARLKQAGAILIGKTTTPEFAHKAVTDSPRYGATHNPWNLDHTCGGSSGGAAVAAATGMGPLAVTTDGAGSSRIPASCCGVLGMKATLGRIPHEYAPDLFGNFSYIGAITRTTVDLALMLNIMSGPDRGDPWTLGHSPVPCKIAEDPIAALKDIRFHYKPRLGNEFLDDDIAAAMERTLEILCNAGALLTRSDGREDWGNDLARITLRAPLAARMARYTEIERAKMDPSLVAAIAESENLDSPALQNAPLQRTALYHQVEALFDSADLLVTPTLGAPPPLVAHKANEPITINGQVAGPLRANWYNYPAPFNLTGHPAISIPCGMTPSGLPIGIQIVAPWHHDQKLIDVAAALERLQPWTKDWPAIVS
jgi:aspartyl-tRNA(Asn)/glutamyl-tRNA(Gln) amidotransferase subunit A